MKRLLAGVISVAGLGLLGLSVAYLERGPIGARLATAYLQGRGIPAVIHFDRLDWRGAAGSAVLGKADHPDLTVAHFDVAFATGASFRGGLATPRIATINLVQPRLTATWRAGRLSFGSLQPLVDDATTKPGQASGPGPDVVIKDGALQFLTPLGVAHLAVDGRLVHGRLTSATLRLRPADFTGSGFGAAALSGVAVLHAVGSSRLQAELHLHAMELHSQGAGATKIYLATDLNLPYASGAPLFQGQVSGEGRLNVAGLINKGAHLNDASLRFKLSGTLGGSQKEHKFSGPVSVGLAATSGGDTGKVVVSPSLTLSSSDLRLAVADKTVSLAALYATSLTADRGQADLQHRMLLLSHLAGRGGGRVDIAPGRSRLTFDGGVSVEGGFNAADALALTGSPVSAGVQVSLQKTLARNLRGFHLQVPRLQVETAAHRLTLQIPQPVALSLASGAVLQVAAEPRTPLVFADAARVTGGLQARLDGPGLPSLQLMNGRFRASAAPGGVTLQVGTTLQVNGSSGPLHDARLLAPLSIHLSERGLTVVATHCATIGLNAFQSGLDLVLRSAQGQICPTLQPLLRLSTASWTLAADLQGLAATLPAAGLALKDGTGRLDLSGERSRPPSGSLAIMTASLADTHAGPQARFRPLQTTGRVDLAHQVVDGRFQFALADFPQSQAQLTIRHDLTHALGEADLLVADLHFEPKALQPESLSPALGLWASQAEGDVAFTGRFAWQDGRLSSNGRLSTTGLDLRSPAGQISGLRADLHFDSLTPLRLEPAQTITADGLQTLLPLTDLSAAIALSPTTLTLVKASATLANGRASLGPTALPLSAGGASPTFTDTLSLRSVDFQDLVSSLNLGKAVTIQAKISGDVPFTFGPAGVRFADGRLAADGPGRLSIRREALTGAVATGGAAGAQPNAVQDFAYQALEDLAFDQLDAAVDSRPQGRLGVVLHVKGRHDPPLAPPSRIALFDLLRGRAFDKPIPLPKATSVDLTLDTSLNFDELLAAYTNVNRASRTATGSSVAVQP